MQNKTIIIAAGGTGGHLFPAEALAQELVNREYKIVIITDTRGNAFKSLGDKVEVKNVASATFKAGLVNKIKCALMLKLGCIQSFFLLLKYKPSCVVGFGGYPSFPPVFTAQLLFFKTVVVEQNAVLGKANIYLAPLATRIAAALPDTKGIRAKDLRKVEVTGNPVREKICALRDRAYPKIDKTINILITGGSQAAKVFSTIIPPAIVKAAAKIDKEIFVMHQCKAEDIEAIKHTYNNVGIAAEVDSFFSDMDKKLQQTHIFIGRSGATTVCEIAVVGVPAIFIPITYHADKQQYHNANILVNKGGAWLIEEDDFTEQKITEKLLELANHPDMLENASHYSKECGKPEAVKNLADLVEGVVYKK